jgi:hypothetical protein
MNSPFKPMPIFGTTPIKCGKRACQWRGFETALAKKPDAESPNLTHNVCPVCGHDSYEFLGPLAAKKFLEQRETKVRTSINEKNIDL